MLLLSSDDFYLNAHWIKALAGEVVAIESQQTVEDLLQRLKGTNDVVVLLDIDRPGIDPLDIVKSIIQVSATTRIFAMARRPDPAQGVVLAQAGVRGYGNSWMHPETLCQSTHLVQMGEVWLGQEVILHLIKGVSATVPESVPQYPASREQLADLTTRELEITGRVATGQSNKLIAYELGITERTVKAHMSKIFQKTGTKDRLQLALLANSRGH